MAVSATSSIGIMVMVRARYPLRVSRLFILEPPIAIHASSLTSLLLHFAGTFTEVWEATFKQAAPAPTDYSTRRGAYRNGVVTQSEMSTQVDGEGEYDPEEHGYPAIPKHRQTFGVTWADYGA